MSEENKLPPQLPLTAAPQQGDPGFDEDLIKKYPRANRKIVVDVSPYSLGAEPNDDNKAQIVKTYPVPVGDMVTLPTILSQIAPQATFSTDVAARTITALASDELHERIGAALEAGLVLRS